jgi:regulatory protein
MKKQKYTIDEAQDKLEAYCAKQERSHQQIQKKLYDWGIFGDTAEEIISQLIQDNYLNEARFALAYAQGKFRMNKWGKIKIEQGLKHHGVSDYNIPKALAEIDESEYQNCLEKLAIQKLKTLDEDLSNYEKQGKLTAYLAQKGFSYHDINNMLEKTQLLDR